MQTIKTKSLSRSLLKGTVVNLGLQLANRNLSKNNFWQTMLVGAAGGFVDCERLFHRSAIIALASDCGFRRSCVDVIRIRNRVGKGNSAFKRLITKMLVLTEYFLEGQIRLRVEILGHGFSRFLL